jgi:ketosteroid isomerase-like protein
MSRENVEVVRGQFEGVNARDFPAVMDAYAEDVVLVAHDELAEVWGQTAEGKEAVGERFGDWFRQFAPGYRFDIEEIRDAGERVFVAARHHGHGRTSGAPVEGWNVYVYTVRDGKVCRVEMWSDRASALEAVGLRE